MGHYLVSLTMKNYLLLQLAAPVFLWGLNCCNVHAQPCFESTRQTGGSDNFLHYGNIEILDGLSASEREQIEYTIGVLNVNYENRDPTTRNDAVLMLNFAPDTQSCIDTTTSTTSSFHGGQICGGSIASASLFHLNSQSYDSTFDFQPISIPAQHQFHCETMDFQLANKLTGEKADLRMTNVFVAPSVDFNGKCLIKNPCTPDTVCHATNGVVRCVAPESDEGLSPVPGRTRQEYFDLYRCPQFDAPLPPINASIGTPWTGAVQQALPSVDELPNVQNLEWFNEQSYMYAGVANLVYADGSAATFRDQLGRDSCVTDFYEHSLGRAPYWVEDNNQRGLSFYFWRGETDQDDDWSLVSSGAMSSGLAYRGILYNPIPIDPDLTSSLTWNAITAPIGSLFQCDYVEIPYSVECEYDDFFDAEEASWCLQDETLAVFSAHDFMLGAYLNEGFYDRGNVRSLPVHNPCMGHPSGPVCHYMGGEITCAMELLVDRPDVLPGSATHGSSSNERPGGSTGSSVSPSSILSSLPLAAAWIFDSLFI